MVKDKKKQKQRQLQRRRFSRAQLGRRCCRCCTTLTLRRVAPDLHCYCRIGKKNPRGWIKGNRLCKLPWPQALRSPYTLASSVIYKLFACKQQSQDCEKLDERVCSAPDGKKKKSEREQRCWWWRRRRRCLAWGRRLRSQQTKLARPLAAELLRLSDFFFFFLVLSVWFSQPGAAGRVLPNDDLENVTVMLVYTVVDYAWSDTRGSTHLT